MNLVFLLIPDKTLKNTYEKLESNFLYFYPVKYFFCKISGGEIQKMTVKGFSITLCYVEIHKVAVKGFSITLWIIT